MLHRKLKPIAVAVGTAFIASLATVSLAQAESPFVADELDRGYDQFANAEEGKCGEGKCGEDKDGEGKCGEEGEEEDKDGEGKCGEGKCGEEEDKDGEGKCGG